MRQSTSLSSLDLENCTSIVAKGEQLAQTEMWLVYERSRLPQKMKEAVVPEPPAAIISAIDDALSEHALLRSCIMLAVQADGCDVTTVEGLGAVRDMHPVQQAFAEHHGLQWGYYTPGMIMAAVDLLKDNPKPTELEIREAIAGNLCRCTGYMHMQIVEAIQAAAEVMHT